MTPPPRQVTPQDIKPLAELWWAGWHEAHAEYVPAELKAQRTLVSFRNRLESLGDLIRTVGPVGAPLGFCAIKNDELNQLFVAPIARGTGLAGALLADGEQRLASAGVKRAHLLCLPENEGAARFYARHGWEDMGVRTDAVDTENGPFPIDAICFEKSLNVAS
ncbi:MAG: GNAT family N-acetyltransferase [Paracoccaceae bacterium]|nr:GNAT family N-acetyltransferase [Paracoccaceae bacterium]